VSKSLSYRPHVELIQRQVVLIVAGGAMSSGDGGGSLTCLLVWGVLCVGKVFLDLIIKLWLRFRSRHLVLYMVTRNLWSARVCVRDWLCKGKMHHPQCTLPKINCIVVWLFFSNSSFYSLVFSKAQSRSLFMRKSLPYQVKSWPF
jgi:hypothetical protein